MPHLKLREWNKQTTTERTSEERGRGTGGGGPGGLCLKRKRSASTTSAAERKGRRGRSRSRHAVRRPSRRRRRTNGESACADLTGVAPASSPCRSWRAPPRAPHHLSPTSATPGCSARPEAEAPRRYRGRARARAVGAACSRPGHGSRKDGEAGSTAIGLASPSRPRRAGGVADRSFASSSERRRREICCDVEARKATDAAVTGRSSRSGHRGRAVAPPPRWRSAAGIQMEQVLLLVLLQ